MILSCLKCNGEGRIFKSKYGGNDPDVWDAGKCEACDGSGSAACDARGCTEPAIAFNDDGEAMCEDCLAERLPAGSWLVWDKVPTGKIRDQGDGEAAWMSGPSRPMRIYRLLWDGVCVGSAARDEVTAGQQRVHPTQKPVALMKWCIGQMQLPPKTIIVDPYMGSGSTGVAAVQLGFPFVGMEIVPQYFDTACRRISEALKQGDMFIERAQAATGSP